MVFDYHGYALWPSGDNLLDGRNFIQSGQERAVTREGLNNYIELNSVVSQQISFIYHVWKGMSVYWFDLPLNPYYIKPITIWALFGPFNNFDFENKWRQIMLMIVIIVGFHQNDTVA